MRQEHKKFKHKAVAQMTCTPYGVSMPKPKRQPHHGLKWKFDMDTGLILHINNSRCKCEICIKFAAHMARHIGKTQSLDDALGDREYFFQQPAIVNELAAVHKEFQNVRRECDRASEQYSAMRQDLDELHQVLRELQQVLGNVTRDRVSLAS